MYPSSGSEGYVDCCQVFVLLTLRWTSADLPLCAPLGTFPRSRTATMNVSRLLIPMTISLLERWHSFAFDKRWTHMFSLTCASRVIDDTDYWVPDIGLCPGVSTVRKKKEHGLSLRSSWPGGRTAWPNNDRVSTDCDDAVVVGGGGREHSMGRAGSVVRGSREQSRKKSV